MNIKKVKKRRNRYLSLIEILLALILVSVAFGVIGTVTWRCRPEEQQLRALDHLLEDVRSIEEIVVDTQADSILHLALTSEGLNYYFELEPRVSGRLAKRFTSKKLIKNIHSLSWCGVPYRELDLPFWGSGALCPRGTLTFSGTRHSTLKFGGVPGGVEIEKEGNHEKTPRAIKALYPQEVLSPS